MDEYLCAVKNAEIRVLAQRAEVSCRPNLLTSQPLIELCIVHSFMLRNIAEVFAEPYFVDPVFLAGVYRERRDHTAGMDIVV